MLASTVPISYRSYKGLTHFGIDEIYDMFSISYRSYKGLTLNSKNVFQFLILLVIVLIKD